MHLSTYGYKIQDQGDKAKGTSGWMASTAYNFNRLDTHNHDGINSAAITLSPLNIHNTGWLQAYSTHSDIDLYLDNYIVNAYLWNYYPGTRAGLTTTGNTVIGLTTITGLASVTGLFVGMTIAATGVPASARLFSIDSATAVTFVAQSGATATASQTGAMIVFADPGEVAGVFGSQTIPMVVSCTGGTLSLNSSDWAVPLDCVVQGGNSFMDSVRISADPAFVSGYGAAVVTHARSSGLYDQTYFYNGAHLNAYSKTGDTVKGVSTIINLSSITNLTKGMIVTGTGIPTCTFVTGVSGSTATLSKAATSTGATTTFSFLPVTGGIDDGGQWVIGTKGVAGNVHNIYGSISVVGDVTISGTVSATTIDKYLWLANANGYGGTNTTVLRYSNTTGSSGADVTYADSAANGATFTIATTGIYSMTVTGYSTSGGFAIGIVLNGSDGTMSISNGGYPTAKRLALAVCAVNQCATVTVFERLVAGDIIWVVGDGAVMSASNLSTFKIRRIS